MRSDLHHIHDALQKPAIDWSFLGSIPSGLTFSRASGGWYFDSTGTLQYESANNAPRFDYDPVTKELKGLLIELGSTNRVRNSVAAGFTAGTPGALPTRWIQYNPAGLTREVVGGGTRYGMAYIRVRYYGTAAGASVNISFEPGNSIAAVKDDLATASVYYELVGGSMNNVTSCKIKIDENDSGSGYLTSGSGSSIFPSGVLRRNLYTRTLTNAATAYVIPWLVLEVTNGAAVDFTIDIFQPQLEKGGQVTSPIVTTGSEVTRASESLLTNSLPWFNPSGGTMFAEGNTNIASGAGTGYFASFNDGTNENRVVLLRSNAQVGKLLVTTDNVASLDRSLGSWQNFANAKMAARFSATDCAAAYNGGTVAAGTPSAYPAGFTRLIVGGQNGGHINGWLRRFRYWNYGLPNEEIRRMTT